MEVNIPLLIQFLFGDAAEVAYRQASRRLLRWSRAFDDWLAERRRSHAARDGYKVKLCWRRLLQERRKAPWELKQTDIEAHAAWLREQGYAAKTIANAIANFNHFYCWCTAHAIEPKTPNPAANVARGEPKLYAQANLLSQAEEQALLDILKRDSSQLGKRDYAFFLARLRMGIPTPDLRGLQWGKFLNLSTLAPEAPMLKEACKMPEEVQKAILDYLQASGRLEGMQAEMYIFAPLAEPWREAPGSRAEDWQAGKPISNRQLDTSLKRYGRLVKIPSEKLTIRTLHHTSARRQLDRGMDVDAMHSFLGGQMKRRHVAYRMGKLAQLPVDTAEVEMPDSLTPPNHQTSAYRPGFGLVHGSYARRQPSEAVAAMLAQDIHGMDEELAMLHTLADGLAQRFERCADSQGSARLVDIYTRVSAQQAIMEKKLREGGKKKANPWEEYFHDLDRIVAETAAQSSGAAADVEDLADPQGLASSSTLAETIASVRVMLRKLFTLAQEAETDERYIYLVDIYYKAGMRLLTLLNAQKISPEEYEEIYMTALKKATQDFMREMSLY